MSEIPNSTHDTINRSVVTRGDDETPRLYPGSGWHRLQLNDIVHLEVLQLDAETVCINFDWRDPTQPEIGPGHWHVGGREVIKINQLSPDEEND